MNAYYYHLDKGDAEAAGRNLDRALSLKHLYPAPWRAEVLLEAAYFTAIYRRDASTARDFLTEAKIEGSFVSVAKRLRAEAATLFAEGQMPAAKARAEAGLHSVKADVPHEREWLQSIADLAAVKQTA